VEESKNGKGDGFSSRGMAKSRRGNSKKGVVRGKTLIEPSKTLSNSKKKKKKGVTAYMQ